MKCLKVGSELDMGMHACNPSTSKAETEDFKFKAYLGYNSESKPSLGYIAKSCLKKTKQKSWFWIVCLLLTR
jgi:hypothetical protein